jgi:phosphonate transport system substrate-binding protein
VYFSDVVVRADSPACALTDLRGASWAYNERTSHSGYAVTRFALAQRGETGAFFGRVQGSGAHLQSLAWLLDGRIDATALDSTVLEQELRTYPELAAAIRRIETFGPSPIPPLVVSRALPHDLRDMLRAALLQMHAEPHGQQVLARAAMSRFVAVTDADYDPIRTMWRVAARVAPWLDAETGPESRLNGPRRARARSGRAGSGPSDRRRARPG